MKKKRFTSYILEETQNELKELSEDTRVPLSAYVEEAMQDLLKKYGREKKKV
jgi:hypothetical protein